MSLKMYFNLLDHFKINPVELELERVVCHSDEEIIHKGHIPHIGAIILNDSALAKSNRKCTKIPPDSIHGIEELYRNKPLAYSIEIKKGGELFYIDKSTILSSLRGEEDYKLSQLLRYFLTEVAV